MENQRLTVLFRKYLNGQCSATEIRSILQHFGPEENEEHIKQLIYNYLIEDSDDANEVNTPHAQRAFAQTDKALQELFAAEKLQKKATIRIRLGWVSAAAVLFTILSIGYFFKNRYAIGNKALFSSVADKDIPPGGNHALLKIAGRQGAIELTPNEEGVQLKNGSLFYKNNSRFSDPILKSEDQIQQAETYYTIETPRGGQYKILLSDGTEVWLNAASSLSYPGAFNGPVREVTVTGEVFFQVAKNKAKPFIVKAGDIKNIVTGTSFNVSAYPDEAEIKTTLVTGGLHVTGHNGNVVLKPGQQAVVSPKTIAVHQVDLSEYISWTNDEFSFENKNIESIMKSISRWYDVDIYYQGNRHDNRKFGGTYTRTKGLSALLNHLEKLSGIHFIMEGRRVKVIL